VGEEISNKEIDYDLSPTPPYILIYSETPIPTPVSHPHNPSFLKNFFTLPTYILVAEDLVSQILFRILMDNKKISNYEKVIPKGVLEVLKLDRICYCI
jgi:hypothetical protein